MIKFAIFFLKITLFVPLAFLLSVYLLNIVWPYVYTESVQDTCSFGPVSNEKYREYLSEMKRRARWEWPSLFEEIDVYAGIHPHKGSLLYRLNDATKDVSGFYERLAITHAVMRASGMRLRETKQPKRGKTYRDFLKRPSYGEDFNFYKLSYLYVFTTIGESLSPIRMFQFDWSAYPSFLGSEARMENGTGRTLDGFLEITMRRKGWLKGLSPGDSVFYLWPTFTDYENTYQRCPTVPSKAWVEAYEKSIMK